MNIKSILLIISFTAILLVGCKKSLMDGEFILKGKIKEKNTKNIKIGYKDINKGYVYDSIEIVNGQFELRGFINGTEQINIMGNTKSRKVDDPNFISFFIESNNISISLVENKFKEAKITGSFTQKENENLSLIVEPIYSELSIMKSQIRELEGENDSTTKDQLKKLNSVYYKKLKKIERERLKFTTNHSNSFLSPYYLRMYASNISLDSLETFYSNLNSRIKNSSYGIALNENISLIKKTSVGSIAPDFTLIDLYGNEINLKSFRGKYVLLDFWAGWCLPCVKSIPELKQIYNKYKNKGLDVISISLDKDKNSWKVAVELHNINSWKNVFLGIDSSFKDGVYKNYNINGIPTYILIDKKGKIAGRYVETKDIFWINTLENKLEEVFK
jgi:thiol-disulfide isomerase/thioredoxin